jgi:alkylated DNA repair dioxygenase AlkB
MSELKPLYQAYDGSRFKDIEKVEEGLLALPWETKRAARHEYFMSETIGVDYEYGGDDGIHYTSKPFSKDVKNIMDVTNDVLGSELNACFLNKYDNEKQHLGWHADDFAGMREDQPIAVVSFGAERDIWVKLQDAKGVVPEEDRFPLGRCSLFVMPPGFQDTHFHRIPKHPQPCGWRISLTFRSFKYDTTD